MRKAVLNRVSSVIVWVGMWNVMDLLRCGSDWMNVVYIVVGGVLWWWSGEFDTLQVVDGGEDSDEESESPATDLDEMV